MHYNNNKFLRIMSSSISHLHCFPFVFPFFLFVLYNTKSANVHGTMTSSILHWNCSVQIVNSNGYTTWRGLIHFWHLNLHVSSFISVDRNYFSIQTFSERMHILTDSFIDVWQSRIKNYKAFFKRLNRILGKNFC